MKKIIPLIIILVFIIGSVIIFTNKKRAYDVVYELDGFQIVESYDFNYYTFNIKKDDIDLDFAVDHEYTNKRKLLKGAYCNTTEDKITTCGINVFNETRMTVVKDNKLYSVSYNIEKNFNNEVLDTVDNVKLYDKDSTILIWDSYGFKDIIHNKEYNFIDKEQYDNTLTYQYDNYLLVPDYNQNKTFNVFYIINVKEQKMTKWKLKYNLSFNSYFLGDKDGLIYLFDKENEKEYTLNIDKKKIKKISDSNGGIAYEGRVVNYSLSDLKYKNISFKNNSIFNYSITNNKLYYNYYGSTKNIEVVGDLDVKSVISKSGDDVYILSGDSIYLVYNSGNYKKIASYFEWNFSANNKVFMFN